MDFAAINCYQHASRGGLACDTAALTNQSCLLVRVCLIVFVSFFIALVHRVSDMQAGVA